MFALGTSLQERWQAFENASLLVTDFDGTIALTDEPAPNGMNVERASRLSVGHLFGYAAVELYDKAGGLQGRAPEEIVEQFAAEADVDERQQLTTSFVETKLSFILDQIGQPLVDGALWPRPVPGFREAWQNIYEARSLGLNLDTSILSSGHTIFISKFFEAHKLPQPDIYVTDDEVRQLRHPLEQERRVKPAPFVLALVHQAWLKRYGLGKLEDFDYERIAASKERITYVGDSVEKDLGLANRSNIGAFELITPPYPNGWQRTLHRVLK